MYEVKADWKELRLKGSNDMGNEMRDRVLLSAAAAEAGCGGGRRTPAGGCARAPTGPSCSTPPAACATIGPWSSP